MKHPQLGTALVWTSWWDNPPKDREILVCVPGSTDHWYLVEWDDDDEQWVHTNTYEPAFNDGILERCHLLPMWADIEHCPSSLCKDAILNTHPNAYR